MADKTGPVLHHLARILMDLLQPIGPDHQIRGAVQLDAVVLGYQQVVGRQPPALHAGRLGHGDAHR
jgi:hypothetical protein